MSNLFVSLHTDIGDPVERLAAVHASTVAAKDLHEALGAEVMETLMGYVPPRPYRWVMRAYSGLDLADRHRAPVNVICSNVPGPREQLSVTGAKLVEFYSAGPILEGIGVNVTAWSYADRMDVMVVACARAMPEPRRLTEALHHQLEMLGR
ncbi:MAG: WS/DGAT domain-containing protein [Microthrixaceae bacterium]|nr:WS/DGAT domain-containing protein [Microthrixaceae bacterium]